MDISFDVQSLEKYCRQYLQIFRIGVQYWLNANYMHFDHLWLDKIEWSMTDRLSIVHYALCIWPCITSAMFVLYGSNATDRDSVCTLGIPALHIQPPTPQHTILESYDATGQKNGNLKSVSEGKVSSHHLLCWEPVKLLYDH